MFSTVTNWLKGKDPDPSEEDKVKHGEQPQSRDSISSVDTSTYSSKSPSESESEDCQSTSEEESAQGISALDTLEDVSSKALNSAKEFGNILFNFGKAAGKTVAEQASKLKTTVEAKTLLGDFSREQEKFMAEKEEHKKMEEAAVAPWIGYEEEDTMKKQILNLSTDKRNFLRSPPSGVNYEFDFTTAYPVAMATLQEDPNLQKMRFDLVPKKTTEENFWRNYFYRVSLIKQSAQLTSQQAGDGRSSSGSSRDSTDSSEQKDSPSPEASTKKEGDIPKDAAQDESVSHKMEKLEVKDDQQQEEEVADWEKELQEELQEYEVVGGSRDIDDAELEQEILQQLEQETKEIS